MPTPDKSTKLNLPAAVARTGKRQLSVSLSDELSEALERIRVERGYKSWGATVCGLIDEADEFVIGGDARTCPKLKRCNWPVRSSCECTRQRP